MNYTKLILSVSLLLLIGYLYDKYKSNLDKDKQFEDFEIVRKYLLGESKQINELRNSQKPILWIHINYEKNSRDWQSFFSRSNSNLNLPYYYFTLKSIISKNNDDFNICIIDDSALTKLLEREEYEYNLEQISDPKKKNVRLLGLAKLVNKYGGLIIPPSFLCFESLKPINSILENNIVVFGENKNNSVSYDQYPVVPDCKIFGSTKNNDKLINFIEYLENIVNNNYTDEVSFNGNINNYLLNQLRKNEIAIIKSEYLGIKNKENKEIYIDDLLSTKIIEFNENTYGLYVPNEILLNSTHYNWFCYLSINEILESECILAKLLVINCDNKNFI